MSYGKNKDDSKISATISKAKKQVDEIRMDVKSYKEDVMMIKEVINDLKKIQSSLIPKKVWFTDKINKLDEIIN